MAVTVTKIVIYPVKSLAGIPLDQADIGPGGFTRDREWMVVDESGIFLTQRQHPSMARIGTAILPAGIRLIFPGGRSIEVPIAEERRTGRGEVWGNECETVDQGEEAAQALSDFLHRRCRLVRMSSRFRRRPRAKYNLSESVLLGFADSMPFLLTSEQSLEELNSRMELPVPMDRFRPNIVVSGAPPYAEDRWLRVRIGDTPFRVVKSCVRCEITTVDQITGIKGVEPLETLGTYRTGPKGILFGRHLAHDGGGTVHVGDLLDVVE